MIRASVSESAAAGSLGHGSDPAVCAWLEGVCAAVPSLASNAVVRSQDPRRRGLKGRVYNGQMASVLELQCHGLLSLQLEAGSDCFLLLLQCQGLLEGGCGGRPFSTRRDGILGGLAPQERLVLTSQTPFSQQLWLHLPFRLLSETFQQSGRPLLTDLLINQWPDGTGFALRPLLESLLASSAHATDDGASGQWWLRRLEASILANLLQLVSMEDVPPKTQSVQPQDLELHELALAFLRAHFAEPLDLGAIAKACACSPRSLQLAFRCHLGQTPMQVLRTLRLEAMRRALLLGETVTQASSQAGLTMSGKLSGLYREAFGESPRETSLRGSQQSRADDPLDAGPAH